MENMVKQNSRKNDKTTATESRSNRIKITDAGGIFNRPGGQLHDHPGGHAGKENLVLGPGHGHLGIHL